MQFHDYSYKHTGGGDVNEEKKPKLHVNIPETNEEKVKEEKPKKRGRQPNSARATQLIANPATAQKTNFPPPPDSPSEAGDDGKRKKFRATFPMARIKKIMQMDDDVGKIAAAVPILVSKCLEMFIGSLIDNAKEVTKTKGAKTMSLQHLRECIEGNEKFNFLKEKVKDIPMNVPTPEQSAKPKRTRQPKAPKDPNEPKVPKKRGRKKKEEVEKEEDEEDEEDNTDEEDESSIPQPMLSSFQFQPSPTSANRTQPPPFPGSTSPNTWRPQNAPTNGMLPPTSPGLKLPGGSPAKRRKLSTEHEEDDSHTSPQDQKSMMNQFTYSSNQPPSPKQSPPSFNQPPSPSQMMFMQQGRNQAQPDTPRPQAAPFFPVPNAGSPKTFQPPQFSVPTFSSTAPMPSLGMPSFAPPPMTGLGNPIMAPPPFVLQTQQQQAPSTQESTNVNNSE